MEKSTEPRLNMDDLYEQLNLVTVRSHEKHPDKAWWEMSFSYAFVKMFGHLLKWFWAGRGNYNGRGAHHLGKVVWYAQRVMWMEINMPINDDRPYSKTKMVLQHSINIVKSVFDKEAA